MKRGFATFAAAMTVVGVAGALAFAPASQAPSQPSPIAVTVKVTPIPTVAPTVAQVAIPAEPAVETRRPPVPLVMKKRTPFDETPPVMEPETVSKVDERLSEASARAAILADGYKNARVLRKGENGLWYAEAMRGATMVRLTVDSQGHVAAQ